MTVSDLMDDRVTLDGVLMKCNRNIAESRTNPDCLNARVAIERLAAQNDNQPAQEAKRKEDFERALSGALSPRAAVKSILGILIMETHLESFSVFEHNNPDCPVQNTGDDEWEFAQAAFETARQLPAGAKRF